MNVEFYPERLCDKHKRVTPGSANCADPPCQERHYRIDGERTVNGLSIDSVTTITREFGDAFFQAAHYGQECGINGYHALLNGPDGLMGGATPEDVVRELRVRKLDHDAETKRSAERGTGLHADAERWAENGELPPPDSGWRRALRSFIETEQPEPLAAEVLVGSKQGAYAGTFDLLCRLPRLDIIGVGDYKSKRKPLKRGAKPTAYPQHLFQLRGYEDARIEMGEAPSDVRFLINLYPDGTYALIQSDVTSDQWQSLLPAYRSLVAVKEQSKRQPVGVAA